MSRRRQRTAESIRLPLSASWRAHGAQVPLLIASIGTGVLIAAAGGRSARDVVGAAALTALGLALTVRAWARPRVEVDPDAVRVRRAYGAATYRWDDIVAVVTHDVRARSGTGVAFEFLLRNGRTVGRVGTPMLTSSAVPSLRGWLRAYYPDIPLAPAPPWRDRFGEWHTELDGYDPMETIRTIRRACVGPWAIRVASCDGGFRARVHDATRDEVGVDAPVRDSLVEATADGAALVREALRRTRAG